MQIKPAVSGSVYSGRTDDAVGSDVAEPAQVRGRGEEHCREVGEGDEHGESVERHQRGVARHELRP